MISLNLIKKLHLQNLINKYHLQKLFILIRKTKATKKLKDNGINFNPELFCKLQFLDQNW